MSINRRGTFLIGTAAVAAGASVSLPFLKPQYHAVLPARRGSRVAVLREESYSHRNWRHPFLRVCNCFPLHVRGQRNIVLKPNLVDYIAGSANQHRSNPRRGPPAECFRRLGANQGDRSGRTRASGAIHSSWSPRAVYAPILRGQSNPIRRSEPRRVDPGESPGQLQRK